jgi:hypothetical protein
MNASSKKTHLTHRARIIAVALAAAAMHAHAACGVHKDFLVRSDPTLAPVRPVDCGTTSQTPPEFHVAAAQG